MLNSNKMVKEFWESEASKNISYHIPIPKPYVDNLKTLLSLSRISVIEEVEEIAQNYRMAEIHAKDCEYQRNGCDCGYENRVAYNRALSDLLAKLSSLKQDSGEIKK